MATTEELNVVIKTVADTSGAQAVNQSLQQTQRVGQQTQQQLTAGQQGANATLRALLERHGQTLESFQNASESVSKSMGIKPTLRPEDFGISPQIAQAAQQQTQATEQTRRSLTAATETAATHVAAQRELRGGLNLTTGEFARFAVSALGLGTGLSAASAAGHLVANALVGVVNAAIQADQSTRNLVATFGSAAANYQQFAQTMSQGGGGFSVTQFQSAAEAVRPLAEQFNLTTRQVEGLIDAARELATIRDIPLSTALDALLGSLQGNAAAANKLGLSMSDQQVAARAAGGAYRQTFDVLSEGEKVTLRYVEALRQVDVQQQNVAKSGPSVTQRAHEIEQQINTLNTVLGQGPASGFLEFLTALGGRIADTTEKTKSLTQEQQGWAKIVENIDKLTPVPSLTPPPQVFGPAPLTGADIQGPQIMSAANEALQQVRGAVGSLATTTDAQLASLAQREAEVMALNAEVARQAIDSAGLVTNALQVALARSTDPAEIARLQAQLDLINRLTEANQSLLEAQRAQNQLQQDGVQLTAQQAAIQLQFLPAQQRLLANERELNRVRLEGQLAALPAQERLEDLRFQEQRDRLIAQNRNLPVEQRIEARRDIRQVARAAPGVELAALEAQRQQTPVDRALARAQIAAGLQQNALAAALAPVQAMIQQNQLLQQIAAAVVASRQETVNIIISGAVDVSSNGAGAVLSDQQKQQLTDAATAQFVDQFSASLNEAERARSARLAGAG
jgi:hypothetical protein